MKEEKLGQEPAFPTTLNQVIGQTSYNFTDENGNGQIGYYNNYADIAYQGVSKRFYAACAAMQGILANTQFRSDCGGSPEVIIEYSYELADTIIRILDLCGAKGIDIEKHIELKMRYNATRERMHGKKY